MQSNIKSWGMSAVVVLAFSMLAGCSSVRARLSGGAAANAPRDNGTPAAVSSGSSVTTLPMPAGSTVETVPAAPATATTPGVPASVKVTLAAPAELRVESHGESAITGTIDTATAQHRITTEQAGKDRAPLLWAAIGAAALAVVAMVMKWPAVATLCGVASGAFFAAWKLAEIPWWVGTIALAIGGAIMLGYKRAEWDANRDFIPDALQKKRPTL